MSTIEHKMNVMKDRSKNMDNRILCYLDFYLILKRKNIFKNINNLTHADDTTLMAESKEELKSLLMKVKGESEKFG